MPRRSNALTPKQQFLKKPATLLDTRWLARDPLDISGTKHLHVVNVFPKAVQLVELFGAYQIGTSTTSITQFLDPYSQFGYLGPASSLNWIVPNEVITPRRAFPNAPPSDQRIWHVRYLAPSGAMLRWGNDEDDYFLDWREAHLWRYATEEEIAEDDHATAQRHLAPEVEVVVPPVPQLMSGPRVSVWRRLSDRPHEEALRTNGVPVDESGSFLEEPDVTQP
jgi:hypothetical protein